PRRRRATAEPARNAPRALFPYNWLVKAYLCPCTRRVCAMGSPAPLPPNDDLDASAAEPVPIAPAVPTPEERLAEGKSRRTQTPRTAHAGWQPPPDRPDPVALLEESSRPRLQQLVPIRYGRM